MHSIFIKNNSSLYVYIVFAILFIGRLCIQGIGYLDDTDELPFLLLLDNYDRLVSLDPHAWNQQVFIMWSNYIETFIRLLQAYILKIYASCLSFPESSTQALLVMGWFNVIISMLISFVFYKILLRMKFKQIDALLGVLLAGTLFNTNLYTRHILPYESSLLFHLISIYLILSPNLNKRIIFLSGVFCALGYFNYYGNFLLLPMAWTLLMYRDESGFNSKIVSTLLLSFPAFMFLIFFEWISTLSGQSYIDFQFLFSTTIFHGSPEEGLIYIYKYFSLVETYWGQFLLFLSTAGIFYSVLYRNVIPVMAKRLFQIAVLFYVIYGLQSVLTGSMVFYGRVLHMFYPFMILGVLIIANAYPGLKKLFFLGAFVNLFFVVQDLNAIGYPRSTMYLSGLFNNRGEYTYVNELKPIVNYDYRHRLIDKQFETPDFHLHQMEQDADYQGEFLLLNFASFFHFPDDFTKEYRPFQSGFQYELALSKPHFMSHPAYTFEYCTKYGRAFYIEKQFKIEVYRSTD